MDFIFRAAEKFLNDRKRLMRYRKVFAVLAAVVVFATTYELILPAITLDRQRAAETPGMEVGVAAEEVVEESETEDSGADEEGAEAAEEKSQAEVEQTQENEDTDNSDAGEESAAPETVDNTDDGDADQTNADNGTGAAVDETNEGNTGSKETTKSSANAEADTSAAATEEAAATATTEVPAVEYPVTLTYEGEDYTVTATFDDTAALPAGVSLDALEILPDMVYKDADGNVLYEDYEVYLGKTVETLEKDGRLEDSYVASARFFDISFIDPEGNYVEPAAPVTVAVKYKEALSAEDTVSTVAVHFDDKKNKSEIIETEEEVKKDAIQEVSFDAEKFSVYAIVGTEAAGEVYDGGTISVQKGEQAKISFGGEKTTYNVKSSTSYSWAIVSGNANASINGASNGQSVTVDALAEGKAVLKLTYNYTYLKKKKTLSHADTFQYTIDVTSESSAEIISEEDATATTQNGSTIDGLTVSVKATGNWRKLSADGYHVVVEDADGNYTDSSVLHAYHIYLAKEGGTEVSDVELANTKNANLQVTLSYDVAQDWLSEVTDIKHYKGTEEPWISSYSIASDYKSVSFNVHGFSDFVFVKNPGSSEGSGGGSSATESGEKYLISKTAASTETENEYEVTLAVNPSIKWPKKQTIVEQSFIDILYHTGISVRNNHNITESLIGSDDKVTIEDLDGDGIISDTEVFKQAEKLGGANGGLVMPTNQLALDYTTNTHGTQYQIKTIIIGDTTIHLPHPWYLYQTSFSNNSTVWLFPNGKYLKLNVFYEGEEVKKPEKHYVNGTIRFENADAPQMIKEAAAEYILEDDIDNWANATIAKPNSVTDPMGDYISFLNFTNIDSVTASGNTATSSYSSASYASNGETITWTFNNTLPKGSSSSDYTISGGKYYLTSSQYILKYKIRLDVHENGFKSTNPFTMVGSENWYNTNNTTTLHDDDGDQNFDIPQVAGILYDLKFTKVDDTGEPVEGAVFALTGSGNNGAVTYGSSTGDGVTTYDKTATSDANGVVTFSGLPWGTYTVFETSAPDGYVVDSTQKTVTLCYTTKPDDLIGSDVEGNSSHLMNKEYTSDIYRYTDSVICIAIKKVDDQGDILTASPQAVFTLTNIDDSNKLYSAAVSASGQDQGYAVLTKVQAGTYTLTETTTPTGYKTIAPATIVVQEDGRIAVQNSSDGLVTKTNALTLASDNGETYSYSAIQVKNKRSSVKVVIRKTDEKGYYGENGTDTTFLSGAVFTLKKGDGTALSGITLQPSDENGYVTTAQGIELDVGTYQFTETTAPDGYNSVSGPITITVNDSEQNRVTAQHDVTSYDVVPDSENNIYTVYIENNPGAELPETGGTGFLSPQTLCGIMAMAFVLATAVMYGFSMRRGERRSI